MGTDKGERGYKSDFHEDGFEAEPGAFSSADDFQELLAEEAVAGFDALEGSGGAAHREETGLRDESGKLVEIDPDEDLT